jgi:hypothetical protein
MRPTLPMHGAAPRIAWSAHLGPILVGTEGRAADSPEDCFDAEGQRHHRGQDDARLETALGDKSAECPYARRSGDHGDPWPRRWPQSVLSQRLGWRDILAGGSAVANAVEERGVDVPSPDAAFAVVVLDHRNRGGDAGEQAPVLRSETQRPRGQDSGEVPWLTTTTGSAHVMTCASRKTSARAPTAPVDSPWGQPSRQMSQPGADRRIYRRSGLRSRRTGIR